MTGFELRISGVGSDRFTNRATTTTQFCNIVTPHFFNCWTPLHDLASCSNVGQGHFDIYWLLTDSACLLTN